ncbi:hypothetical protein [Micromonospora sp. NPDC049799]
MATDTTTRAARRPVLTRLLRDRRARFALPVLGAVAVAATS